MLPKPEADALRARPYLSMADGSLDVRRKVVGTGFLRGTVIVQVPFPQGPDDRRWRPG